MGRPARPGGTRRQVDHRAGLLLGFGCTDPSTEERVDATERRTYGGRALAVLRPTGPGEIHLLASARECEPVDVLVTAE